MTSVRGRMALSRCSSPSTEGGSTTRVPSAYGTRTASPWPPSLGPPQRSPCTHELGKPSRQNSHVPSDIKKGDHAIPFLDIGWHMRPDLLDHPHPLVSHAISRLTVIDATIRPQIRATNPRMRNAGNHIGWGLNDGIGDLVDVHISGSMINGCSHVFLLFLFSTHFIPGYWPYLPVIRLYPFRAPFSLLK